MLFKPEDKMIAIEYGLFLDNEGVYQYIDNLPDNKIININRLLSQDEYSQAVRKILGPMAEKLLIKQEMTHRQEIASRKELSEYYGNIGDKVALLVTLKTAYWLKRNGVFAFTFVDSDGHIFSAFYNGTDKFKKGLDYNIVGIIKSHKEYEGTKQTGLSKIAQVKE